MKKAVICILMGVMALGAVACGRSAYSGTSGEAQTDVISETTEQTTGEDTCIITDILGREVEIPVKIDTVAAINSAARMLTYAGATDKLAGVTDMDKSNVAGMPYSLVYAEKFAELVSVGAGGSNDTTYTEELVVLNPDIVFAFTSNVETLDELQSQAGIPVVGLYAKEIFDESFYSTLELVGRIMGTEEHCSTVIEAMKGWQDDLSNRTKDIPEEEKPSVYAGAVSFRGGHGIEGTYGLYPPFTAINAKNVVDETEQEGPLLIDLEKVTIWDPDIIFLNPANLALVNENYEVNASFYDNLTAIQTGQVYSQVAYNYNSCNMELAMADAYYAGKIIYPEQFEDIDFNEKAEEIFQLMLGQSYLEILDNAGIGFGPMTIGE